MNYKIPKYSILKTGANSIVLGKNFYSRYFNEKDNKLLKITKLIDGHNEFSHLDKVRNIKNYSNFFTIPDEEIITINPKEHFYDFLKEITKEENLNIFYGELSCMFIDYAGDIDLADSIDTMITHWNKSIWTSIDKIILFSKHIMMGLKYLHEKKICHLDIKPENIMINTLNQKFTIIDFGFASMEPFEDYINNIKGTPGYFPKRFENLEGKKYAIDKIEGLPLIKANDMLYNKPIPMQTNRSLVYKIDSYCLGRVISLLYYHYNLVSKSCLGFGLDLNSKKYKKRLKLKKLIKLLTKNDVYSRPTITEILNIKLI